MAGATPKVARTESATEFAWTMFPMPKAASGTSSAKIEPSHGSPRPFLRVYMAPPRMLPEASVRGSAGR